MRGENCHLQWLSVWMANAPFFVLPNCSTSLSLPIQGIFPPFSFTFLCVTAGASQARPETIEPLGTQPGLQVVAVDTGQQGAFLEEDLAALVSGGRALIRTGDCSLRDKIFIFPECRRRMRCHASISYTVAPENIPIFIQKFFISVKLVICAFKSI